MIADFLHSTLGPAQIQQQVLQKNAVKDLIHNDEY